MAGYQHILVAIDVGGKYSPVVEKALELAGQDCRVSILHVVEPVYYPENYTGGLVLDIQEKAIEYAQGELDKLCDNYGLDKQTCTVEVGSPAKLIVHFAETNEADLITIGSHGRHGLQLLMGSTANAVLHHAKCDVLAIRVYD